MTGQLNCVYMTPEDHRTLTSLLERLSDGESHTLELLENELDRAEVFDAGEPIPENLVTMHAFVCYTDLDTHKSNQIQIVYPHEVDISQSRVSILSAVGSALIGLREGDEIQWPMPSGKLHTLKIDQVIQTFL